MSKIKNNITIKYIYIFIVIKRNIYTNLDWFYFNLCISNQERL